MQVQVTADMAKFISSQARAAGVPELFVGFVELVNEAGGRWSAGHLGGPYAAGPVGPFRFVSRTVQAGTGESGVLAFDPDTQRMIFSTEGTNECHLWNMNDPDFEPAELAKSLAAWSNGTE